MTKEPGKADDPEERGGRQELAHEDVHPVRPGGKTGFRVWGLGFRV